MSSVRRYVSQVPSRYLWSEDGPYIQTFAQMQRVFASYNPVYIGSTILFANDVDLGSAVYDLERDNGNSTDSHISLLDLGKKVYLGVQGGDSELFTYSLIRVCSGNWNDGSAYYVLSGVGPISVATTEALDGYGEVYCSRGAN